MGRMKGLADDGRTVISEMLEALAASIAQARVDAGLSQRELGQHVGVDQTVVSTWENGRATPTLERIIALDGALGLRPGTLLERAGVVHGRDVEEAVAADRTLDHNGRLMVLGTLAEQRRRATRQLEELQDLYRRSAGFARDLFDIANEPGFESIDAARSETIRSAAAGAEVIAEDVKGQILKLLEEFNATRSGEGHSASDEHLVAEVIRRLESGESLDGLDNTVDRHLMRIHPDDVDVVESLSQAIRDGGDLFVDAAESVSGSALKWAVDVALTWRSAGEPLEEGDVASLREVIERFRYEGKGARDAPKVLDTFQANPPIHKPATLTVHPDDLNAVQQLVDAARECKITSNIGFESELEWAMWIAYQWRRSGNPLTQDDVKTLRRDLKRFAAESTPSEEVNKVISMLRHPSVTDGLRTVFDIEEKSRKLAEAESWDEYGQTTAPTDPT